VVFNLPTPDLERQFLLEAEAAGLFGLDGHRSLGGIRASLYNAVTLASVDVLTDFMQDFQSRAGTAVLRHALA
jgi:phosphoserine aminotransferase